MQQILNVLPELMASIIGVGIGWLWGHWRARNAWKKKEFRSSLVLSLNSLLPAIQPEYQVALKLRTLFERNLEDVFPNRTMRDLVNKAIDKTTETDPLLRFEKEDSWHILNTLLNQIAEMYAEGCIKRDMGLKTEGKWYVLCLTFERSGSMRTQKPRVMLVEREKLLQFPDEGKIELENATNHSIRVQTLRLLKKEYQQNPHLFLAMEITF